MFLESVPEKEGSITEGKNVEEEKVKLNLCGIQTLSYWDSGCVCVRVCVCGCVSVWVGV